VNIVSVSWSDHLSFGEADGRLDTPGRVARRVRAWRDELGARSLHWRLLRARIPGTFEAAPGFRHPSETAARTLDWDDFDIVPTLAHETGLSAWLYVSLFDEGWPLAPDDVRAVSYHNAMHGQHVAWQSELTRTHSDWVATDRAGSARQWGVVSLSYPAARQAFIDRWRALLSGTRFDGLFVCLRSQSRPADTADQFGFNEPARAQFAERYGVDVTREAFDIVAWRRLLGEYLTTFVAELRDALRPEGTLLALGLPRGDVLGPPLGNAELPWREWVRRRLVDRLIVNQNSSQCPSMWHQLWPMHRGTGYVQNYFDGTGLPPFADHMTAYGAAVAGSPVELYIARQWCERDDAGERQLASIPGVTGLVFGSFRHDNPGPVGRNDWTAGNLGKRTS
jgi:SAM-dependent methyltransferase